jgi:hypothetical protein
MTIGKLFGVLCAHMPIGGVGSLLAMTPLL